VDRRTMLSLALARPSPGEAPGPELCLFTDHLDDHGYSFAEVAGMLRQLGIGPDLTVRPGGLVLPEQAERALPAAVAAFREQGLAVPMISTGLTRGDDPTARPILRTAGRLGIRYFKVGYYPYGDLADWRRRLAAVRRDLGSLLAAAREHGLRAGFHNHSGPFVGGAVWDTWELLRPLDREWVGFYFDPAQATIEGGNHAWKLNLHRAAAALKMVAIKDFVWERVEGGWRTRWVPLGDGMVRWEEFFRELARLRFAGPLSLHIEYDPGGSTRAQRFENCFAAAERDLRFLRARLRAAGLAPG